MRHDVIVRSYNLAVSALEKQTPCSYQHALFLSFFLSFFLTLFISLFISYFDRFSLATSLIEHNVQNGLNSICSRLLFPYISPEVTRDP